MPALQLELVSAPALVSGTPCEVVVDIRAPAETRVRWVRAELVAEEGWELHRLGERYHAEVRYATPSVELQRAGVLRRGPTRFTIPLEVPATQPPTHQLAPAFARVSLAVHVARPWRRTHTLICNLVARRAPQAELVRTPLLARGVLATASRPRLELTLATTTLPPGAHLAGTCAVRHVDAPLPAAVELALVPVLTLVPGRDAVIGDAATSAVIPVAARGVGVPFQITIPASVTPSFTGATHELSWVLRARLANGVETGAAVQIVEAARAAEAPPPPAAPKRALPPAPSELAGSLALVALRRQWRLLQRTSTLGGELAIEGEVGATRISLAYAYDSELGTLLISTLRHPSLGLDLLVSKVADVEEAPADELAAWYRAHEVIVGWRAQAAVFMRAVVPALLRAELGSIARWHDTELRLERAIASVDASSLDELATALESLAHTIAAAALQIPPPPQLTVDLDAWRALAHRLDGTLTPGNLSIDGRLHGTRVSIVLLRDDNHPSGFLVTVGDPTPEPPTIPAPPDGPHTSVTTSWPSDFTNLCLGARSVCAALRLPTRGPRRADPARLEELAHALRAVLAAITPGAGPYR